MKKYIIKVTYLEGIHKGKEYYLIKGGYVTDNNKSFFDYETYNLATCKAVCKRLEKSNNTEVEYEKKYRDRRRAEGKIISRYPIYELQKYEPYEVEI